jgi:prepilin-type processing-associated H-X9-DG protein
MHAPSVQPQAGHLRLERARVGRYACSYADNDQEAERRATLTLINASSNHPGGVNMLFTDGSVRFIKSTVNYLPYFAIETPNGGETVSADSC